MLKKIKCISRINHGSVTKRTIMRRYKVIKTLGFIVVCCVLTGLLYFGLKQYNIDRVNIYRITTQKYDDIFVGTSHGLSALIRKS